MPPFHTTSTPIKDKPLPGFTSSSSEIILIAINATGTKLVTSRTDKSIRIWKCLHERLVDPVIIEEAHTKSVESISWDPNHEQRFASVGRDDIIKIWKASTGKMERQIKLKEGSVLKIIRYSIDGKHLIVVDRESQISLYSTATYKLVTSFQIKEHIYDLQWFNSDYFVLALHDGSLPIYKVGDTIELLSTLIGHRSSGTSLTVDPRGSYFAAGSNEGVVSFWNTKNMLNTRVLTNIDEAISHVDASRDGGFVAVSYDKGSNIRVFDTDLGKEVWEVPGSESGDLAFATVVWFPNRAAMAYTGDKGKTLMVTSR